jgi:hypothetical protein
MFNTVVFFIWIVLSRSIEDFQKLESIPVYSELREVQKVILHSDYTVTHQVSRNLLIYSKEGLDHARVVLGYDKLQKIESFEAEIVNPTTRKVLKKAKLSDMGDRPRYSQVNFYDDNRIKFFQVESSTFPIEVRLSFQVKSKTNFVLPRWILVPQYNQRVLESTFSVSYPVDLGIRYKAINLQTLPRETLDNQVKTLAWEEKDLPVQEKGIKEVDDHRLLLAPNLFGMEGYVGKMEDWGGLASWQFQLNEGRDILPDEFKSKVHQLTDKATSDFEKIQILYGYLQKNFRYVSIQLGIGGWQTMQARDVVKYGYGDCKGLTNLMKAMLKEVGISSQEALVFAGVGEKDIEQDLVSNQFNHVILKIQADQGPIWLECTSSNLPAGYLGDFTNDRHVLLIQKSGGKLDKTPRYDSYKWNSVKKNYEVILDEKGEAKMELVESREGNPASKTLMIASQYDENTQRDYFTRNSSIPGLVIREFQLKNNQHDSIPVAELEVKGIFQRFSQNTAKRLILKQFFSRIQAADLAFKSFSLEENFEIQLPNGLVHEFNLDPVLIEESEYTIKISHQLKENQLSVSRQVKINLPSDMEEESIKILLSKINSLGAIPYSFLKTSPVAQSL